MAGESAGGGGEEDEDDDNGRREIEWKEDTKRTTTQNINLVGRGEKKVRRRGGDNFWRPCGRLRCQKHGFSPKFFKLFTTFLRRFIVKL